MDVHPYRADNSLRCFHVNLTLLGRLWGGTFPDIWVRVIASSGSALVGYHGIDSGRLRADLQGMDPRGVWDAEV